MRCLIDNKFLAGWHWNLAFKSGICLLIDFDFDLLQFLFIVFLLLYAMNLSLSCDKRCDGAIVRSSNNSS